VAAGNFLMRALAAPECVNLNQNHKNEKNMSPAEHKKLSKLMSLILRHEPQKWGLTLDANGFVALDEFLHAIHRSARHARVDEAQIREVVRESDKQRYEIDDGDPLPRIRARYGHSIQDVVSYPPIEPPEVLFHGTSRRALEAIRATGLQSMKRQYVHLSNEREQAQIVGVRHDAQPIILSIRAHEAWQHGVRFYNPEPRIFLADEVPPQWIDFE
jgi:putative RNA 2'-phosphotransferase